VADKAIRHALRNVIARAVDPDDEDIELFLGPDEAANLIEVGVVQADDGFYIIHAMPGRIRRFFPPERR
jgi:hypothetical protein